MSFCFLSRNGLEPALTAGLTERGRNRVEWLCEPYALGHGVEQVEVRACSMGQ